MKKEIYKMAQRAEQKKKELKTEMELENGSRETSQKRQYRTEAEKEREIKELQENIGKGRTEKKKMFYYSID